MTELTGRKERERQRHREEILEAGEEVFAEKGFHRATVEDVATRCGFSVGTLYNFFQNKEDLYHSLIAARAQQMSDEANAALDEAQGPRETVETYVRLKIRLSRKYEKFLRLYARERMGDRFTNAQLWRQTVAPLLEQVLGRVAKALAAGREQGCFREDVAPEDMTIALDGLTDGFLFEWLTGGDSEGFARKEETMVKIFWEGVRKR